MHAASLGISGGSVVFYFLPCFLEVESTGHHFIAAGLNPRLSRIVPRK